MKTALIIVAMAVGAMVGLSGCGTTEASLREKGMVPLKGSEIQQLFGTGKPMEIKGASGRMFTGQYNVDGSAALNWGSGGDQGNWRVEGDTFCAKWKEVRGGEEACFRIYRTSDNEYQSFHLDGRPNATIWASK